MFNDGFSVGLFERVCHTWLIDMECYLVTDLLYVIVFVMKWDKIVTNQEIVRIVSVVVVNDYLQDLNVEGFCVWLCGRI